jgi:predicted nucleotidyltransferase
MIAKFHQPDPALVAEATQRIVDAVSPQRVVLFGSAASGRMKANSDLDVLVVVQNHVSRRTATQSIYRRLYGFPMATDVVVVTEDDVKHHAANPGLIIGEALRDGRELYRVA